MHFAQFEKSPRLQLLHSFLSDREWHSTFDIMMKTKSCAVHSDISELRANGFDVHTLCFGKNENGKSVYKYKLAGERKVQMELAL